MPPGPAPAAGALGHVLAGWSALEIRICRRTRRLSDWAPFGHAMGLASRLGDGSLWYALIALLALTGGDAGRETALRLLAAGAIALAVYKAVKHGTARPRPCEVAPDLLGRIPPLDRWSFPSGHTMHAIAFTATAVLDFPWLAWILAPLAAAIMLSRVALGLHYPTDVAAGAVLGGLVARVVAAF